MEDNFKLKDKVFILDYKGSHSYKGKIGTIVGINCPGVWPIRVSFSSSEESLACKRTEVFFKREIIKLTPAVKILYGF